MLFGRPTDALVSEALFCHLFGLIDVAQVHDQRMCHLFFESLQIQRAKLLPFCHDDQGIGFLRTVIGAVAIRDIR
jgi:hypothetical protein